MPGNTGFAIAEAGVPASMVPGRPREDIGRRSITAPPITREVIVVRITALRVLLRLRFTALALRQPIGGPIPSSLTR
jgi:hypothetical protein